MDVITPRKVRRNRDAKVFVKVCSLNGRCDKRRHQQVSFFSRDDHIILTLVWVEHKSGCCQTKHLGSQDPFERQCSPLGFFYRLVKNKIISIKHKLRTSSKPYTINIQLEE